MSHFRRWFVPGATYFFTVVTYHRAPLFRAEPARSLLRTVWLQTQQAMPFTNLASVLLHDHFHCLWTLPSGSDDYSTRLQRIKAEFTMAWLAQGGYEPVVSSSQRRRGNRGVWQRRFWEHVIRDQDDLERHFDYIHFNPVKHGYVSRPGDWAYSTFQRYVRSGHYSPQWGRQCPSHIEHLEWE